MGKTVGRAIYEQYIPASIEDAIPSTIEGQVMGLADRIQTITEMFGIGSAPTGSKDPFALRRAANAVVKILAESKLPLRLSDLLDAAGGNQGQVANFLGERLSFYLKDVRGFAYDVVSAVLAASADNVCNAIARAEALTEVRGSEDFAAISISFKRIKNILRQAEEKGYLIIPSMAELYTGEAEKLYSSVDNLAPKVAELSMKQCYSEALALIATLRPVVDEFFDKVMILDPDPAVRGANLGLINKVLQEFSGIADFSEIVVNVTGGSMVRTA
jgi:glycyl-tRNA synthetase beta chain